MQDEYQQVPHAEPQPKKQLTAGQITLIVVAVAVGLCICAIAVIVVLTLTGPAVGNTFSTILEGLEGVTPVP